MTGAEHDPRADHARLPADAIGQPDATTRHVPTAASVTAASVRSVRASIAVAPVQRVDASVRAAETAAQSAAAPIVVAADPGNANAPASVRTGLATIAVAARRIGRDASKIAADAPETGIAAEVETTEAAVPKAALVPGNAIKADQDAAPVAPVRGNATVPGPRVIGTIVLRAAGTENEGRVPKVIDRSVAAAATVRSGAEIAPNAAATAIGRVPRTVIDLRAAATAIGRVPRTEIDLLAATVPSVAGSETALNAAVTAIGRVPRTVIGLRAVATGIVLSGAATETGSRVRKVTVRSGAEIAPIEAASVTVRAPRTGIAPGPPTETVRLARAATVRLAVATATVRLAVATAIDPLAARAATVPPVAATATDPAASSGDAIATTEVRAAVSTDPAATDRAAIGLVTIGLVMTGPGTNVPRPATEPPRSMNRCSPRSSKMSRNSTASTTGSDPMD